MKRGEIWSVSGSSYSGRPRPAVIIQSDQFETTASVTICSFTSDETDAPLFRIVIMPSLTNGLYGPSRLMVDKIMTVSRQTVGKLIGELGRDDLARLHEAIVTFLALGNAPTA